MASREIHRAIPWRLRCDLAVSVVSLADHRIHAVVTLEIRSCASLVQIVFDGVSDDFSFFAVCGSRRLLPSLCPLLSPRSLCSLSSGSRSFRDSGNSVTAAASRLLLCASMAPLLPTPPIPSFGHRFHSCMKHTGQPMMLQWLRWRPGARNEPPSVEPAASSRPLLLAPSLMAMASPPTLANSRSWPRCSLDPISTIVLPAMRGATRAALRNLSEATLPQQASVTGQTRGADRIRSAFSVLKKARVWSDALSSCLLTELSLKDSPLAARQQLFSFRGNES